MNKLIYRGYNITEQNGVYSCEDPNIKAASEDQIYKKIDQHKKELAKINENNEPASECHWS